MNRIKIISVETIQLSVILLAFFLICLLSCSKSNNIPPNNNEVNATVTTSSGVVVTIRARKLDAGLDFTSGWFSIGNWVSGGTTVSGLNASKECIVVTAMTPASATYIISSPGTYNCGGMYRLNAYELDHTYENMGVNNGNRKAGSITFTTINDSYMEGYFNVTCWNGLDSVTITGTFKGDHIQK